MQKTLYSRGHKAFLKLLVEMRKDAGLTQVDLAKKLKVDQSWVSKVERGIRRLDLVELAFWCRALEVPLAIFVKKYEEALSVIPDHTAR